ENCERLLAGRMDIPGAVAFLRRQISTLRQSEPEHQPDNPQDKQMETSASLAEPSSPPPASPTAEGDSGAEARAVGEITPSACACGGKQGADAYQKVFVLGKLSFDYGTRSRRLYFANAMRAAAGGSAAGQPNIDDPANLYNYLTRTADRS